MLGISWVFAGVCVCWVCREKLRRRSRESTTGRHPALHRAVMADEHGNKRNRVNSDGFESKKDVGGAAHLGESAGEIKGLGDAGATVHEPMQQH